MRSQRKWLVMFGGHKYSRESNDHTVLKDQTTWVSHTMNTLNNHDNI